MRILCVGGCGYVGSRLVPKLLADGHEVTVMDKQFFGDGDPAHNDSLTMLKCDTRSVADMVAATKNKDAIIELSSMSNNSMYEVDPIGTGTCNFGGSTTSAVWRRVDRYIYASSVAAYGTSEDVLTEDSPLKPTTKYGEDKARCEEVILTEQPNAIIVRAASVYGHSPNMRFDTPVNSMTRDALNKNVVQVNGGKQHRCHIHIDDLCDLYRLLLKPDVNGVFNAVEKSLPMLTLGKHIAQLLDADVKINPSTDERSYVVSGNKAEEQLAFIPIREISEGVKLMHGFYAAGNPQYREYSDLRIRMLEKGVALLENRAC